MKMKSKLKSTKVFMDEDFSAKLRVEREQLFEIVKGERKRKKCKSKI